MIYIYWLVASLSMVTAREVLVAARTPLKMQGTTVGYTYHAPEGHRVFAVSPVLSFEFPYALILFNPSGNLIENSRPLTMERAVDLMRSVHTLPLEEVPECSVLLARAPPGTAVLNVHISDDGESFEVID